MVEKWLQKAEASIEAKGTEGSFSAKAKRANMTTEAYAKDVIKRLKGKTKNANDVKLLRQATFALNAIKAAPKMHNGGKVPRDGLYHLEKGERVIPKDRSQREMATGWIRPGTRRPSGAKAVRLGAAPGVMAAQRSVRASKVPCPCPKGKKTCPCPK